jgi:tRNA A-37 threonylcarbamoyl transferase component Bud32
MNPKVKFTKISRNKRCFEREIAAYKILTKNNFKNIPKLLTWDSDSLKIELTYISGLTLSKSVQNLKNHFQTLGNLVGQLHHISEFESSKYQLNSFNEYGLEIITNVFELNYTLLKDKISVNKLNELKLILESNSNLFKESKDVFCHGDISSSNVIVNYGKLILIDFERFSTSHRCIDAMPIITNFSSDSNKLKNFIIGYNTTNLWPKSFITHASLLIHLTLLKYVLFLYDSNKKLCIEHIKLFNSQSLK